MATSHARAAPRLGWLCTLPALWYVLGASAAPAQQAMWRDRGAGTTTGLRVVISIDQRRLWVVSQSNDSVFGARVAVGSGATLRWADKLWTFATPRGATVVTMKESHPIWIPPDWVYAELAHDSGFALARIAEGGATPVADGLALVVRHGQVGETGSDSIFQALSSDEHIIFGNTLYIPPFGTKNRRVERALGPYRIRLANGVDLHGTPERESVGQAVTHGCIRLSDDDVTWLYRHVPLGTRVYIF